MIGTMRALVVTVALAVAGTLAACKKPPPAPAVEEPAHIPPIPDSLPGALGVSDYVGAAACAECHRAQYDAWQHSPHGRSMAVASPDTVLAPFDGTATLADGQVTFSREGD